MARFLQSSVAGPVGDSAEDVLELELQGQNSSSQLETRQKGPKIGAPPGPREKEDRASTERRV